MNTATLETLLKIAALAQLAVAILNLFLVRMLHWREAVSAMPLLLKEVFYVHSWYISITLTIFAAMTWRFATEMAAGANAMGVWLAMVIGIFWGIRVLLQLFYYSANHWRHRPGRIIIHIILLVLYGGMTATYLTAAKHRML